MNTILHQASYYNNSPDFKYCIFQTATKEQEGSWVLEPSPRLNYVDVSELATNSPSK